MHCCVPFCRNSTENVSKTDGISFHAFPDEDSGPLRAQWLRSLGMQGQVPASAAVCSQHFLHEDMRDARGERCLRAGAVPTAVQVCLICLDTDSPMISMSKYNLGEAYVHLTGYSLCNEGNLRHILCMECAQRLTHISKFREKSLRARTLLMDLIEKYQMITPLDTAHLRSQRTLDSSQACCTLGSDPCDLHMLDGTSTYAQTDLQLGSCLGLDMPQARESADGDSVDIIRQIALLDKAQFIRQLHQHHSVLRCWVKLTRISLLEDIGSCKTRAMSSSGETSLVSEDKTVPEYALQPSLASDYAAKSYCYDQSQQVFHENEIGEISNNNSQANTLQTILTPSMNDLRSNNVSNLALKNCLVLLHDVFEESNGPVSKLDESLTEKRTAITHETNAQRKEIYTRDLSCDESTSHSEVPAQESIVNNVKVYKKSDLLKAVQSGTAYPNIDIKLQCEEMPATNKDRYTCDTCQNDFRRECSLLKHIMLTHTEEKFFSCELCKYSTKYKNNFVLHMEAHQSEKYFACALCDFKCTVKSSIVRHLRSQTCIKSLTCKLCQYKCTTKSSFIEHKREHRLQKRFACKLCDYKDANSGNLKRHMLIHIGAKPYSCDICPYKARFKSNLVEHIRTHTREKPFACKLCQYKCVTKSNLVAHMCTHSTEKRFACHLCKYKGAVKSSLQKHMKVHIGGKPYACQFCPYKSNFKSNLVEHIRTHTGEKPYACTVCQREFSTKTNVLTHMKIHSGEKRHACKLCQYKSFQKANLDRHMLTHTGEKKIACNLFQAKFTSQSTLTSHILRVHTDYPLGPGLNSRSQQVFDEIDQTRSLTSNKRNGKKHIPTKRYLQGDNMSNISLKNCFVKLQDIFKELESDIETTSIQSLNCCETTSYNEVPAKESVIKDAKSYERELSKTVQREKQGLNIDIKLQREELPATNKDRYTCDICNNDFLKKSAIVKHIMSHTGEQLFSCELCKYSTKYKNNLAIHMEAHKSDKFFACALCEYKCTRKSSLLKHLRSRTCTKTLTCKLCQYKCSTKRSFIKHKREHNLQKHFACKLCDYKGARSGYLQRHMKIHTGEKPFACTLCNYKCVTSSNLVAHMRIHSGIKPFACNLCEYKSALKASLRIHMRIHTGEKPYACQFCPYKSNFKSNLVEHIRTHTGEKPFACTVCQSKFSTRPNLMTHMKSHSGDKPYACKLCEFKCVHKWNLNKHLRTHTGEKPFVCNLCQVKLTTKSSLQHHIKIHTGEKPFACKLCQYKCNRRHHLTDHMRRHTGEKPFTCKLCHFKSATSSYLVKHMKNHLGEK